MRVTFDGAVIDSQSYLDGTRELTLEGEATGQPEDNVWQITLTVRWPKDEDPDEGDLSITRADGGALYAALREGTIAETVSDSGDTLVELALMFTISAAEGSLEGTRDDLRIDGTIAGGDATLVASSSDP